MRYSPILFFLLTSSIWALPCNHGAGIIYKGDSVATVLKQCGQPSSQNIERRIVYTSQDWIYTRRHVFDPGITQMIVSFRNERVSNIHIIDRYLIPICRQVAVQLGAVTTIQTSCGNSEYNTSFTNLCSYGFGIGESTQTVAAICGLPAAKTNLQTNVIENIEFTYQGDNAPQTIIFENGKITDFK